MLLRMFTDCWFGHVADGKSIVFLDHCRPANEKEEWNEWTLQFADFEKFESRH